MSLKNKIESLYSSNPKKNIIFYFDEDGSRKDELQALTSHGFTFIQVDDKFFSLKYQLEYELKDQKIILYHPYKKPLGNALKQYPLLGLLTANLELKLDAVSEFINAFGLKENHYTLAEKYYNKLKTKSNQRKLTKVLDNDNFTENNLRQGLISIALGFNTVASKHQCMAQYLVTAIEDIELDRVKNALKDFDLNDDLVAWFNTALDIHHKYLNELTLRDIVAKLKYNIITFNATEIAAADTYAKLKIERAAVLNKAWLFYNDWQEHASLSPKISEVFDWVNDIIIDRKLLEWYGGNYELLYYSATMVNHQIKELFVQATETPLKAIDKCKQAFKIPSLSNDQRSIIHFIQNAARVFNILSAHNSFTYNKPEDYLRNYATELYQVDQYYRHAIMAHDQIVDGFSHHDKKLAELLKELNHKYDRFLIELNVSWQKMLTEIDFNYNKIAIDKQYDFYQNHLLDRKAKTAVIISDALRFEIADEFFKELLGKENTDVALTTQMASIPSYTNLGMSNLLPNAGITVENGEKDLVFKINGISTSSPNRDAILKQKDPRAAAIALAELDTYNKQQGIDYFKERDLVYIYHDWIDSIGDKRSTERGAFDSTEKAIDEIKKMLSKLNTWRVSKVIITSDHGFIYNQNNLEEYNREPLPNTQGYTRDHLRFVVAEGFDKKTTGYRFKLNNTTNIDTNLEVLVPKALNRYKKQGNVGLQFVHGGASLQEVVVPVLSIKNKVKTSKRTVSFIRTDNNERINSGTLKVELLQSDPVSNEIKAAELNIGIYSEKGELLSNEVSVSLNSASINPKDRINDVILTLNNKGSKATFGYLKAYLADDKQKLNPYGLDAMVKINTTFEIDDFGL